MDLGVDSHGRTVVPLPAVPGILATRTPVRYHVGMLAYQTSVFGQGAPTVLDTGVSEPGSMSSPGSITPTRLAGADELLADLADALPWRHSRRPMYGRLVDEPRLHAMLDAAAAAGIRYSTKSPRHSNPGTARACRRVS